MPAHALADRFATPSNLTTVEAVPDNVPESARMADLRALSLGWDGDDAPAPSDDAIGKAKEILEWIQRNDLQIDSVDADVLGGVDVYLNGTSGRTAWVAILNSGERSIVLSHNGKATGHSLDKAELERMKSFLLGGGRGSTTH